MLPADVNYHLVRICPFSSPNIMRRKPDLVDLGFENTVWRQFDIPIYAPGRISARRCLIFGGGVTSKRVQSFLSTIGSTGTTARHLDDIVQLIAGPP